MTMSAIVYRLLFSVGVAAAILVVMTGRLAGLMPSQQVAYVAFDGLPDLTLMDVRHRLYVQFEDIPSPLATFQPAWSPDGSKLAYISDQRDPYVLEVETGELTRLTDGVRVEAISWAPNGQQIMLMASFTQFDSRDVYIIDLRDYTVRSFRLGLSSMFMGIPKWSPNGERLAFVAGRNGADDVYTLDVATGDIEQRTNLRFARAVDWSPDGRQMVIASDHEGPTNLYLIDADGLATTERGKTRITFDIFAGSPTWSPDGERIAFYSYRDGNIYTIRPNGEDLQIVTTMFVRRNTTISWSADGQQLYFSDSDNSYGSYEVHAVDLQGRRQQLTSNLVDDVVPVWRP